MLNPQETSPRSLPVTWVAENTFLIGTSAQHTKGLLHKYYCGTNSLRQKKKMQLGIFVQRANSISSWSSASGMLSCG